MQKAFMTLSQDGRSRAYGVENTPKRKACNCPMCQPKPKPKGCTCGKCGTTRNQGTDRFAFVRPILTGRGERSVLDQK